MLYLSMFRLPVFYLLVLTSIAGGVFGQAKQTAEAFEKPIETTLKLNYLLSLPERYENTDKATKWPLVIFLHGAGERGDNLDVVKKHGPPKLVEAGRKFPFILVSPQCPKNGWWTEQPVLELLDDLEKGYRVDADRIYLTGLSMGGYGTWHFSAKAPGRFAAVAPVCGGGVPYLTRSLKSMPVWAFHGAKDSVVPLNESERLIKVIESNGNENAKLTVYPEANHDSWTAAYNTDELYEWLLSQRRIVK